MRNEMEKIKISSRALQVLRGCARNDPYVDCKGMSEHGGRQSILFSLARKGLIDWENKVTEAGTAFLAKVAS
jgi:hypothetical protein